MHGKLLLGHDLGACGAREMEADIPLGAGLVKTWVEEVGFALPTFGIEEHHDRPFNPILGLDAVF